MPDTPAQLRGHPLLCDPKTDTDIFARLVPALFKSDLSPYTSHALAWCAVVYVQNLTQTLFSLSFADHFSVVTVNLCLTYHQDHVTLLLKLVCDI